MQALRILHLFLYLALFVPVSQLSSFEQAANAEGTAEPQEVTVAEYRGTPVKLLGPVGADALIRNEMAPPEAATREDMVFRYEIEYARTVRAVREAIVSHWLRKLDIRVDPKLLAEERDRILSRMHLRGQLADLTEKFGKEEADQFAHQVRKVASAMARSPARRATLARTLIEQGTIKHEKDIDLWLQSELKHVKILRGDALALFVGTRQPLETGVVPVAPPTPPPRAEDRTQDQPK